MTMIRTYSELRRLETFNERWRYLALNGRVGAQTFGFDRWINQQFYQSTEWRNIRHTVIARDLGCDLGVDGYEIHTRLYMDHLNPMQVDDLRQGDSSVIDPEYLITTTHQTHNAIHYGDESLLPRVFIARHAGDTKLW